MLHRYLSSNEEKVSQYLKSVGGIIRFNKDLSFESTGNWSKPLINFFYCPYTSFHKKFDYIKPSNLSLSNRKNFDSHNTLRNDSTLNFVLRNTCIYFMINVVYPEYDRKRNKWVYSSVGKAAIKMSEHSASSSDVETLKDLFVDCGVEFIRANWKRVFVGPQQLFLSSKRLISWDAAIALRKEISSWWDWLSNIFKENLLLHIGGIAQYASLEYYYHGDPDHKRKAPVLTILPEDRYASSTKLRNDNPILVKAFEKYKSGELRTQKDCVNFIKNSTGTQIALITLKRKFKIFKNREHLNCSFSRSPKIANSNPALIEAFSKFKSGDLKTKKECKEFIKMNTGISVTIRTVFNMFKRLSKYVGKPEIKDTQGSSNPQFFFPLRGFQARTCNYTSLKSFVTGGNKGHGNRNSRI